MSPAAKTLKNIGEFGLIEEIAKIAKARKEIVKGIGDDAAVVGSQGKNLLLLTADMLAEGVHFTKNMGARSIGHKAMACSVSDIAAMGGLPLAAVVSLGATRALGVQFVKQIYAGMERLARRYRFSIVGGDTIKSPNLVINVALLGTAKKENIVYRFGARPNDMIFTSGPLGRSFTTKKHLTFTPRLRESQYLIARFKPTSMIDISDGLAGDLGHILKASRAGAVLYEKLIPKTPGATIQNALFDGEDFELLFTLSPQNGRRLMSVKKLPFHFSYIGDILQKKDGLTLVDRKGKRKSLTPKSFTHF